MSDLITSYRALTESAERDACYWQEKSRKASQAALRLTEAANNLRAALKFVESAREYNEELNVLLTADDADDKT